MQSVMATHENGLLTDVVVAERTRDRDDVATEQNGDEVFEENNNIDELNKCHNKQMVSDQR